MEDLIELIPLAIALFSIVYGVVQRMAAREAVDGWDTVKAWMDEAKPLLDDWNDPNSPSGPKSPQNPTGRGPE